MTQFVSPESLGNDVLFCKRALEPSNNLGIQGIVGLGGGLFQTSTKPLLKSQFQLGVFVGFPHCRPS